MFTQVPAAAPTSSGLLGTQVSHHHRASSASHSSRPSRLRGLSYLRSYTHNHLLSREHSGTGQSQQHSQTTPPSTIGGTSQPQASSSLATSPRTRPASSLYRTTSASASSTLSPNDSAAAANNSTASSRTSANRRTLVGSESHPFGLAPPPRPSAGRRSTDSALPPLLVDLSDANADQAAEPRTSTPSSTGEAPSTESNAGMVRTRSATMSETPSRNGGGSGPDILPSIRFSTFYDPRAARPSLTFTPISRTLPTGNEVIRVGRYSERDSQPNVPPNVPSAAPVGFKSKVVSRRHCEFWYEDGKWYIKDVKSSSGTFLNHIRLSPPGTESKPFPINDGDIVQLGIDFKGGEEMIFRCVKLRLELNRGWQNKLNTFNMTTHKRLRNMTASSGNTSASQSHTQDCSICLNSIAPCQCLFVAPCSHTWHYKCIRSLLSSPSYPIFICPNCRAAADLEADVEDPEEWEQDASEEEANGQEGASLEASGSAGAASGAAAAQSQTVASPRKSRESARSTRVPAIHPAAPAALAAQHGGPDAMDVTMMDEGSDTPANDLDSAPSANARNPPNGQPNLAAAAAGADNQLSTNATSSPMAIPTARASSGSAATGRNGARTPSPTSSGTPALLNGQEGPITPRNDAGPWVFDGSGVRMRRSDAALSGTTSLNAAANRSCEMILDEVQFGGHP